MEKYDFRLTPGYCLYNGAAVRSQEGSEIEFLVENLFDSSLQGRLEKAFRNYVEQIRKLSDCPESFKSEVKIRFLKGSRMELKQCVSELYGNKLDEVSVVAEKKQEDYGKNGNPNEEAAAVLLLESILIKAKNFGATDIHIEENQVRFRMEGSLKKILELEDKRCLELIQRIKLLSGMNVLEKRKSQDGSFRTELLQEGKNPEVFVRVSTVPVFGKKGLGKESVVLRILDPGRVPLKLEKLGYSLEQQEKLKLLCESSSGLILICGPTGAGKSTTAAALLNLILENKNRGVKIISLEDPPEYVLSGVTQIQIDENNEKSFGQVLKHVFRQDPDVIMIGEIRDEKSAQAALRASLTGHLVFATLHTSTAAESLFRLENLGLDKKLLISVLRGIVVQELEYFEKGTILLADVCSPGVDFCKKLLQVSDIESMEGLFEHLVNGKEVLSKTAEFLVSGVKNEDKTGCRKRRRKVIPLYGIEGKSDISCEA